MFSFHARDVLTCLLSCTLYRACAEGKPAAKRAKGGASKSKVTIKADELKDMSGLLRYRLLQHEAGQDVVTYKGMQWNELRDWYLAQVLNKLLLFALFMCLLV